MPAQHVHVFGLAVLRVAGGAQHRAQPLYGKLMLQLRGKGGEERMPDGRHDHADKIRAIVVQVARQFVRYVVQRPHGLGHAGTHVVGHITRVVDHQRHRAQRHSGLLRHIAHAHHIRAPFARLLSHSPAHPHACASMQRRRIHRAGIDRLHPTVASNRSNARQFASPPASRMPDKNRDAETHDDAHQGHRHSRESVSQGHGETAFANQRQYLVQSGRKR